MRTAVLHGKPAYRTKTTREQIARSFAKAVSANARFGTAEVFVSPRATVTNPRRFYVVYFPSREIAADRIRNYEQAKRVETAISEGKAYTFKPAGKDRLTCLNPKTGETYWLSPRGCSCEDYTFTAGPLGILCKHMVEANRREMFP
jgi:hypothetical protein